MNLNNAGITLIQSFESCKLAVYLDGKGLATVGWGHRTSLPVGSIITQEQADSWFVSDTGFACTVLKGCIHPDIILNDNQFSALVSLAFNIGTHYFATSTLLKLLNNNQISDIPNQFLRWCHDGNDIVPGLLRRRNAEVLLFQQQPS